MVRRSAALLDPLLDLLRRREQRLKQVVDFGVVTPAVFLGQGRLQLAHRLTPNSSIQASLGEQRSVGTAPGLESSVRSASLGLSTLLARRTSGSLQVRRAISDGAIPYSESAVIGTITHRF